ncbi:hypothetical protein [Mycobacterium sp. SM3041]|uniref:hypothetical protein n=1 Tax=Mycobacterium sp. SM3041 TaxID=3114291 RepID=UPI003204AB35
MSRVAWPYSAPAVTALVVALTACGMPSAAAAPGEPACPGTSVTAQQFVGAWTSPDDPTTTTLAPDGALRSRGAGDESGTWSVRPIGQTPGAGQLPDDGICVLWLHWASPAPSFDAFYVPLKVTGAQLELSYVGRGNTLTWIRADEPR